MTKSEQLRIAYERRIADGVDVAIYKKALGLLDDCPDIMLWSLTHASKETFNAEFEKELGFYFE